MSEVINENSKSTFNYLGDFRYWRKKKWKTNFFLNSYVSEVKLLSTDISYGKYTVSCTDNLYNFVLKFFLLLYKRLMC